jgi:hypothetical protein
MGVVIEILQFAGTTRCNAHQSRGVDKEIFRHALQMRPRRSGASVMPFTGLYVLGRQCTKISLTILAANEVQARGALRMALQLSSPFRVVRKDHKL